MNNRFSIPSTFYSAEEKSINNPNFHPVKLRIMSSGTNWNNCDFVIDSLEVAKDTVSYAPILANIVQREDGELDANGHDVDFEMKVDFKGNVTFKETYIEKPVGVFLANSCERKYDIDNDVYYLEAYGYVWKQYSEIYEILKRDEIKDVSVEVEVQDGSYRDTDGVFEIRKFNVLGCTILGNGVLPAIDNSQIEFNFSLNNDKEYEDNLRQLDILLQNFCKKGGEDVEEKDLQQEFEQEEIVEEPQEEVIEESQQEFEQEEVVEEPQQEFAEDEVEEEENVCPECGKPQEECECEDEAEEEFSQEVEEVVEAIIINEKIYSQDELDKAVEDAKAEFAQAMEELAILREFKAEYDRQVKLQKLNEEMDNLLVNFNVNEELVKELKEKVINGEYTMDKFELELFRNNTPMKKEFSKKEEKQTKLPIIDNEEKLSDIDRLFAKYGVNKK